MNKNKEQGHKDTLNTINLKIRDYLGETKGIIVDLNVQQGQGYLEDPEERSKVVVGQILEERFVHFINLAQSMQFQAQQTIKDKIKRQIQIFNPNLPEEELAQMLNNKDNLNQLLQTQKISQSSIIKNVVSDISQKCNDLQQLEESVKQLHKLIQNLKFVVKDQGRHILSIRDNMQQTREYVERGAENLQKAKEEYVSGQEMFWCFFVFLTSAMFLSVLILFKFFFK